MNTISLHNEDESNDLKVMEIPDLQSLPEDLTIRTETRKTIAASIDELPDKLRDVLVMREITGMSYEEMASALNVNVGTIKSRLARSRIKLVGILNEKGTFSEGFRQKI